MTLTKTELIEKLYNELRFPKNQCSDIAEALIELIKQSLEDGEDVLVSGFGKFCVKQKAQRRGRNPVTNGDMTLRPRRVVTFHCSGKLRERLKGE